MVFFLLQQYLVESANTAKYKENLESKDGEIAKLKATIQNMEVRVN